MDAAADSERTPASGREVPPVSAGGTDAGAPTTPASGVTSEGAPAVCGTGSVPESGRPAVTSGPGPGAAALVFDDPLDRLSADDTDRGWGELPAGSADDDFTRFLREKPPHHL